MSYSIYYRAQFIKVSDNEFIPMFETGDNNVYENSSTGRRHRSWYEHPLQTNKTFFTKEEILAYPLSIKQYELDKKATNGDTYSDRQFGYFTAIAVYPKKCYSTTYRDYENFFIKAIKNAKTIDELKEFNVYVELRTYVYNDKEFRNTTNLELKPNYYPKTIDELKTKLAEYQEYYKDTKVSVFLSLGGSIDRMFIKEKNDKYYARIENKVSKPKKEIKQYYILEPLENMVNGYFVKMYSRGIKFVGYPDSSLVKKFKSIKAANTANNKITMKMGKTYFQPLLIEKPISL